MPEHGCGVGARGVTSGLSTRVGAVGLSCMSHRLLCFGLLLGAAAPAAQALVEHKVEKKFAVPVAGAVLAVDTFTGAVTVTECDGNTIEITVTEQCDEPDEKAAAAKFADLDLAFNQDAAGHVAVTASYRQKVSFTWKKWPPVVLVFDIKVPLHCDANLTTGNGDITIGKLRGKLLTTNDSGKIFVGETDGTVTARSRTGEIGLTACTGMIEVTTLTGNISIGRALGGARLASDGGDIEVQQAGGDFRVNGNGSQVKVRFAYPLVQAANVMTSGGSIVAIFDQRSAAMVSASCAVLEKVVSRGLKSAGLPDGETRSRLTAKLNDGGPVVTLSASGGSVLLRGEPPGPEVDVVKAAPAKVDVAK